MQCSFFHSCVWMLIYVSASVSDPGEPLCSRSPCKNKGTCIQDKAESRACVRLDGLVLTAMFQCLLWGGGLPQRWALTPETQGSVHEVLTNEQHCRARVVIVGGEREGQTGNEWARLWRKGLKWKVKGRGASLEILKRNVLDGKEGMFHFQHLFIFLTYLFLIEG